MGKGWLRGRAFVNALGNLINWVRGLVQQEGSILIKNINGLVPNPDKGKKQQQQQQKKLLLKQNCSSELIHKFYAKNNK